MLFKAPQWRIQYYQTFQNKITYDFIGRVERLKDDLIIVGDNIGIDMQEYYAEETRHETAARERIGEYSSQELRRKIISKYEIDFQYFSYDF